MSSRERKSLLDAVQPAHAEPMREAMALGDRAAIVGFDWELAVHALDKVAEEVDELREVLEAPPLDQQEAQRELGDLLFAACMVARKADLDPVEALAHTNAKFRARFAFIERELARRGVDPADASLDEMESIWQASKARSRAGSGEGA